MARVLMTKLLVLLSMKSQYLSLYLNTFEFLWFSNEFGITQTHTHTHTHTHYLADIISIAVKKKNVVFQYHVFVNMCMNSSVIYRMVQGGSFGNRPKKMRISQRLFIRF